MKIRLATQEDCKSIIEFQLAMAIETENLQLDFQTVKMGVEAVFIDPSKGKYFVAEDNSEMVGCLMITYEWSDWRNATIWWLQSLYVLPKWRNKGAFSLMFNFLKEQIHALENVCGLRLYVDQSNKNAQMIYAHLGMTDDHYRTFEWMKRF